MIKYIVAPIIDGIVGGIVGVWIARFILFIKDKFTIWNFKRKEHKRMYKRYTDDTK